MQLGIDITRRTFLVHAGRGTIALAVLGVAGCGPSAISSAATPADEGEPSSAASPRRPPPAPRPARELRTVCGDRRRDVAPRQPRLRVGLHPGPRRGGCDRRHGRHRQRGRDRDALTAAGLGWDAVGHVILTHRHGDHAGSIEAIIGAAPAAAVYAGAEDIPAIAASRPVTAVGDGENVFGLRIVTTPGHTAGHIAVLDEVGRILVAGDALGTTSGSLAGSNPQFTEDAAAAKASISKMGALEFDILLVGHGEPILEGAAAEVAALAAAG